jgi:hypothetical protein
VRAVLLVVSLAAAALLAVAVSRAAFLGDFRAFYCAGAVALRGANPYFEQPLHNCELATMPANLAAAWRAVAIPAPLPGYAVAFFAVFTIFPFPAAAALWVFVLVAAVAAAGIALARLTRFSALVLICALALSLFGTSLMLGQVVPLVVAALCVAALCAERQQWNGAAIAAAVSTIEPHIGVPVCIALALFAPRTRVVLGAAAAVLALLSLGAIGPGANLEYLRTVLPAHTISEIASDEQYSLSVVLQAFGIGFGRAAAIGAASYLVMAAAGVLLARSLASRLQSAAFLVLVPPAIAVFGGAFVHLTQMAVAIPAALLLAERSRTARPYAVLALVLLAIPWPMAQSALFAPFAAIVAVGITWELCGRSARLSGACAAAAFCAVLTLNHLYGRESLHRPVSLPAFSVDARLAEAGWGRMMLGGYSGGDALTWWKRLPTWSGLAVLLYAISRKAQT